MNRSILQQWRRWFANLYRYPAPVRILVFVLMLLLLWLPFALPIYWFVPDQNLAGILALLVLYSEFLWLVGVWGRRVYRQPQLLWQYGLEFSQRSGLELLCGLGIGLFSILLLFGIEASLGWLVWQAPVMPLVRVFLEGLLVAIGIGFAEELFFRGWLLDELQRDYVPSVALWGSAIVFATVHLRLITLPALILLGVALVWAKRACSELQIGRRRERLGLPIGLHAGLVWGYYMLNVGQLVRYTNRVPAWVTGLENNPLAGLLGLILLSGLTIGMWQFTCRQRATVRW